MHPLHKNVVALALALVTMTALVLVGCAGERSNDISKIVPVDSSDECEQYRAPLREATRAFDERIAAYIAASPACAGVGGLITGGPSALGGVSAACLGGAAAAGYYYEKSQRTKNQAQLQRAIDEDSVALSDDIGPLGNAVRDLKQCRSRQVASLTDLFSSGKTDRATAQAKLASIEARMSDDQRLVDRLLEVVGERADIQVFSKATAKGLTQPAYTENLTPPPAVIMEPSEPPAPALPPLQPHEGKYYVAVGRANLRSGPARDRSLITRASLGAEISMVGRQGGWFKGTYEDQSVFIYSKLVSRLPPEVPQPQDPTQRALLRIRDLQDDVTLDRAEQDWLIEETKRLTS